MILPELEVDVGVGEKEGTKIGVGVKDGDTVGEGEFVGGVIVGDSSTFSIESDLVPKTSVFDFWAEFTKEKVRTLDARKSKKIIIRGTKKNRFLSIRKNNIGSFL